MPKQALAALLSALLAALPSIALAVDPDPRGVWLRDDGNARVRIGPCGDGDVCATNLWIGDTSSGEAVGDKLIMTLKPQSETTLAGRAYDPKRKLTYSITVEVAKDRLATRGCVVGGMICKTVSWKAAP